MKILMLGDARTEHMTRWVRHFRERGDTVWLASAQATVTTDIELKLPLRRDFVGYPLLVPVLRRLIDRLLPDLVVAHYLPNYGLLAALSGFRPHVIVGWGSDLLVLPHRGRLQRARLRLVATRGQAFMVDAQMLVEPLVRLGAPADRVHVCPFGVDADVMGLDDLHARDMQSAPVILCNRKHEPAYHIDDFLTALAMLGKTQPDLRAQIANSGSITGDLDAQSAKLGLSGIINWTGRLCRTRYLDSLARADIYVSPAPSDSTSVSLLEAMGAGLAVVATDIPGNREWIADGENGLLYPPGDTGSLSDCMRTLLTDSQTRHDLGRRARATVKDRGLWSQTIQTAENLFAELTGS